MLKVLVAVDGSTQSQHAIDMARRLQAEARAMETVLIHVRHWPVFLGDLPPARYEDVEREQISHQEGLLAQAFDAARRAGLVSITTAAAVGEPAPEIARAAKEKGIDLIVMGTHGRGAVGSLIVGSVAQSVVHLAEVPVVLVK